MNWPNLGQMSLDITWLLFLLVLFRYFWKKRSILVQAQGWLQTKGHIIRCEWTMIGHSTWPKIEYMYQVYEKDIIGEYLFLDTMHNTPNSKYSRSIAYKVSMAFKNDTEIDVFYNPNHPEQSALDVSIPKKLNVILGLLISLMVYHLIVIFSHFL